MAKKQDFDKDIHLSSFDDLFQTDESREDLKRERLMEIPISLIHDFPDHPYKVKDDENKILIAVVIGALLLTLLYALFNDTIMPTVTEKVEGLFNYAG